MSHLDLDGKVVLITGGADGIGLATARRVVGRGAKVVILDRNDSAANSAANELGEHRALAIGADVTDRDAMRFAVDQTVDRFGRLDVVVANAGVTPPPGTLRTQDPAEFDKVIAVNLTGVLNTVQPAIEPLIRTGGHIVVVASCAAFSPPAGGAAYMVSKAAVEVLARGLRLELAPHGVTVTTSYFGIVETQLARATLNDDPLGKLMDQHVPWPLRRRITAEQAARAITNAIESRAHSRTAPGTWIPLGLMRGILTPLLDLYLVHDRWTHHMIRQLESRHEKTSR